MADRATRKDKLDKSFSVIKQLHKVRIKVTSFSAWETQYFAQGTQKQDYRSPRSLLCPSHSQEELYPTGQAAGLSVRARPSACVVHRTSGPLALQNAPPIQRRAGETEPPARTIDTQVLPRHTGNAMENQETSHSSQGAWQKVAHKSEHHCFLSRAAKLAGRRRCWKCLELWFLT